VGLRAGQHRRVESHPPEFELRTLQPVTSRCTAYALPNQKRRFWIVTNVNNPFASFFKFFAFCGGFLATLSVSIDALASMLDE
jgi:hypothetical protein